MSLDVAAREKSGNAGVTVNKFGFVSGNEIEPQLSPRGASAVLSFNLSDRLLEQLTIQIETHRHDVAALGGAENTAGAANLEITHGNAKTGAERTVLFDRVDSFARGADHHELARQQEVSVSLVLGPPDAARGVDINQPGRSDRRDQ